MVRRPTPSECACPTAESSTRSILGDSALALLTGFGALLLYWLVT